MKSVGMVQILFLFFYVATFANNKANLRESYEHFPQDLDSLHLYNSSYVVNEEYAKRIIEYYRVYIENERNFTKEDYKRLAVSYAYLKKATEASEYLDKYIKTALSVDIMNNDAFKNIRSSNEYIKVLDKYKPQLSKLVIFLFFCGLIGLFISVVLNLRKKGDFLANLLISVFVLINSLFIIHVGLFLSRYKFGLPHSLYITTSFTFLYGPLLYFYFKRISEQYRFRFLDIIHLLPTMFLLIYLLPIYFLPPEDKLFMLYNRDETIHNAQVRIVIFKYLSLIAYGYMIYQVYFANKVSNPQKTYPQVLKWQRNLVVLNSLYIFSYIIHGFILMKLIPTNSYDIYPHIMLMSFIVLYIAYTAYVQPRVFSRKYIFNKLTLKYIKSGLTESYSLELKEQLLKLLNDQKVYKKNDISLNSLSEKMGVTRHNLSQVINEHFDVNFFNLINKYRIQEAQLILKNDAHNNLHIIDVAYDVGFNNKVTFNKAFKDETKLTPTQFLQSINANRGLATSA